LRYNIAPLALVVLGYNVVPLAVVVLRYNVARLALFGPPVLNFLRRRNALRRNPLPKRIGTMLALFSV
jgi:hypothetical protein